MHAQEKLGVTIRVAHPGRAPTSTRPPGPSGQMARPDYSSGLRVRSPRSCAPLCEGGRERSAPWKGDRGATVWRGRLVNLQTRLSSWWAQTWRVFAHFPTQLSQQITGFFFLRQGTTLALQVSSLETSGEKNHCC